MKNEGRPENEVGVAFTASGNDPMIPEDTIGTVWLGPINDRSGKRLFRGKISVKDLPAPIGDYVHLVLFPFTSRGQVGISIQYSRKHHCKQEA